MRRRRASAVRPDIAQRIENAIRGRTAEVGEALMAGPGDQDGDIDAE